MDDLLAKYANLFTGIGKLKNFQVRLHRKKDITPVTQPHRKVPFCVKKHIKTELQQLEELDIIEMVDGLTPWVSPIVLVPKPKDPNTVHLCVNRRLPNKATEREVHLKWMMSFQLLLGFFNVDLNSGYLLTLYHNLLNPCRTTTVQKTEFHPLQTSF